MPGENQTKTAKLVQNLTGTGGWRGDAFMYELSEPEQIGYTVGNS